MIKYKVVLKKDSWLMRAIGFILKPFNKTFMTHFVSSIGSTIYTPSEEMLSGGVVQHELQHISDSRKWPVLYELSYYLVLPFGITMRSFWERRGYRHTIKHSVAGGISDAVIIDWLRPHFTGTNYLWMDLRKKTVTEWIEREIKECREGRAVETIEAVRVQ